MHSIKVCTFLHLGHLIHSFYNTRLFSIAYNFYSVAVSLFPSASTPRDPGDGRVGLQTVGCRVQRASAAADTLSWAQAAHIPRAHRAPPNGPVPPDRVGGPERPATGRFFRSPRGAAHSRVRAIGCLGLMRLGPGPRYGPPRKPPSSSRVGSSPIADRTVEHILTHHQTAPLENEPRPAPPHSRPRLGGGDL